MFTFAHISAELLKSYCLQLYFSCFLLFQKKTRSKVLRSWSSQWVKDKKNRQKKICQKSFIKKSVKKIRQKNLSKKIIKKFVKKICQKIRQKFHQKFHQNFLSNLSKIFVKKLVCHRNYKKLKELRGRKKKTQKTRE